MILHEEHEVNIYYQEGEENEMKQWVSSWKNKGYKVSFEALASNGEQGNITMKKRLIPKEWLTSTQN